MERMISDDCITVLIQRLELILELLLLWSHCTGRFITVTFYDYVAHNLLTSIIFSEKAHDRDIVKVED